MGRGTEVTPDPLFFYESDLNFFSSMIMNLDIKINFKGTALGFVFVKKTTMKSFIVQEACRCKGSGLCVLGVRKGF